MLWIKSKEMNTLIFHGKDSLAYSLKEKNNPGSEVMKFYSHY